MKRRTDPLTRLLAAMVAVLALGGALLLVGAAGPGGEAVSHAGRAALALGLLAAVPVATCSLLQPAAPRETRARARTKRARD